MLDYNCSSFYIRGKIVEQIETKTKFCKFCGQKITADAVVCIHCGRQVEELKSDKNDNIIINNSASSASTNSNTRKKKKYNLLLDLILIFFTCGLWFFWMLMRPKYEY